MKRADGKAHEFISFRAEDFHPVMSPPDFPWTSRARKSQLGTEADRATSTFFPIVMVSWRSNIEGEWMSTSLFRDNIFVGLSIPCNNCWRE
jgi:hypothetical protein